MFRLNDTEELIKFNSSRLADSIRGLDKQVEQVFEELAGFDFPDDYKKIQNVVVCGMGGSGLNMRVFQSLFASKTKVPTELINDYTLPAYANEHTFVLLCSYSGTTEEILACSEVAMDRKAKIAYLCAGGTLAEMGEKNGWFGYNFEPKNNPSKQPRMGLGYAITALLVMLAKLGIIENDDVKKETILSAVRDANVRFEERVGAENNLAKETALATLDRQAATVGAEHLKGSAWVMRNQIHENSKNYANAYFLPELNHHLLEGLGFPEGVSDKLHFIFIESENYSRRIKQRFIVTKKILDKQKIEYSTFCPDQKEPIGEVYETLIFGSWVSYYLAYLNGIDPAPIPFVDLFKEELSKI